MTSVPDARRLHWIMVALVFAVSLTSLLFAERIQLSDGLGMDGTNYGAIAADFHARVFRHGVNAYYLQRAAPSAIVHYGLRLLGRPTDIPNVILGFQVLNLLLLVGSALLWRPIADELHLGSGARWLGFIALFVNYANLKHAWYMPVFTDVTAFALGVAYLWCYLAGRQGLLLLATLVGAFCWPIASISGAVLLMFPRGAVAAPDEDRSRLPTLMAAAISGALIVAFVYMYFVRHLRKVGMGPTIPPIAWLVPVALLLHAAWIYLAYRGLFEGLGPKYLQRALRSLRARNVVLALVAIALPAVIIRLLAAPDPAILSSRGFLRSVVFLPIARPLVTLVSHVVWFGPALWLIVFCWKRIGLHARAMGPGIIGFFALAIFVALTPESRQSNLAVPFFVALLAMVMSEDEVPSRLLWVLGFVSLALSKIWLRINTSEALAYASSGRPGLSDADSALQYRLYYLSQGPWMPNRWYAIQAAVVLVVGVTVFVLMPKRVPAPLALASTSPTPRSPVRT